jgi:hypothetical protein
MKGRIFRTRPEEGIDTSVPSGWNGMEAQCRSEIPLSDMAPFVSPMNVLHGYSFNVDNAIKVSGQNSVEKVESGRKKCSLEFFV